MWAPDPERSGEGYLSPDARSAVPRWRIDCIKELTDAARRQSGAGRLAHRYDVMVSTGGFMEYVLTQGSAAVDRYVDECREVGFDIVEISCGFVRIPADWGRIRTYKG